MPSFGVAKSRLEIGRTPDVDRILTDEAVLAARYEVDLAGRSVQPHSKPPSG